jgi:hypothetical protein
VVFALDAPVAIGVQVPDRNGWVDVPLEVNKDGTPFRKWFWVRGPVPLNGTVEFRVWADRIPDAAGLRVSSFLVELRPR